MSSEKKSRVVKPEPFIGKTNSYRVWGGRDLSRHILTFVCVADQLLLRRCCRMLKQLADEWWKDPSGMIKQFWLQFTRETGFEPEDMDKIRQAGGFYCSPTLAAMIQPPRIPLPRSHYMSFDSYDFIVPDSGYNTKPIPEIFRVGVKWKWMHFNRLDNKVHAFTRLGHDMVQCLTYNDKELFRPQYETGVVITGTREKTGPSSDVSVWKPLHKYRVVNVAPKEYISSCTSLPWERCCFDGKRLFIANVGAFISKMATFQPSILMPLMSDFRRCLDSSYVDLIQKWRMLGFNVLDNPKYPLDPKLPGFRSEIHGTYCTLWEILRARDRNYNFPRTIRVNPNTIDCLTSVT